MATNYWLTFRLAYHAVAGRSYEQRYDALRLKVGWCAIESWAEPTSFFAFSSAYDIDEIARACKQAIAPSRDMFLLREIDRQSARICGHIEDHTVFRLMPYLQRVPLDTLAELMAQYEPQI